MAKKIVELQAMHVQFLIVCGERFIHPNVVYRTNFGKWDAVNFGAKFLPVKAKVVVLNDVDTKIHNFESAHKFLASKAQVIYCRVKVPAGPQLKFYKILDPIRARFHICASGELMLINIQVFKRLLPIPPCIAEDSYLLFKALELGCRPHFCTEAYVTTKRTSNRTEEEAYKSRTTLGIYQALSCSKPKPVVRVFYYLLPAFSPLLMLFGRDGVAWVKGIRKAIDASKPEKQVTKF